MCEPTPFFLDAEDLALNSVFHKRSKHRAIQYLWVKEHMDPDGEFQTARLIHMRTGDQIADIFTKALTGLTFLTQRRRSLGTDRKTSIIIIILISSSAFGPNMAITLLY